MKKARLSEISKLYGPDYFKSKRDLSQSRIRKTVRLLGDVEGKSILDLGCGTGEGSILLRNLGARVICADISKFAALTCRDSNFNSVVSTAHLLPFRDKSFDGVLFMDVIEHVQKDLVVQTLLEIRRVTKASGKIAIHTMPTLFLEKLSAIYGLFNKRHWRRWGTQGGHINTYYPWRLERDLISAGLQILRFEIGEYPRDAPFSRIVSPCSSLLGQLLGNDMWVCCASRGNETHGR